MIAALIHIAEPPRLTVPAAIFADVGVTAPPPRLDWPEGTIVRAEEADGELIVRFDRPLASASIDAFRAATGDAIGDLRWNDDTLVLRPAPGWSMTWRQTGQTVTVGFTARAGSNTGLSPVDTAGPGPGPGPGSGPDADPDDRERAIAAIQADAAAGYPGAARRRAADLAARHPDDAAIARLLADTQAAVGDGRSAARGYRALRADDRAARRVVAAAAGSASIGITLRDGSDLSQVEGGARVDAAIGRRASAGIGLRQITSRVAGRAAGDATVIDATAGMTIDRATQVQIVASAALDDAVTGGGVRLVTGAAEAQFRATMLRHMPDYSTAAQVVAGGYLSRALIGVTYRLTPGLIVQADGGAQRYGLAGAAGASDTIVASAGADYLIRRQFPALGLTYRYEAEYVQRMRRGGGGSPIVPLATRENHTLQGLLSGAVGVVQMTGLAGWTVDRFGGDGPTASLGVAAPIGIGWRIEGSAGITSIARAGFSGQQLFARAQLTRSLGTAP